MDPMNIVVGLIFLGIIYKLFLMPMIGQLKFVMHIKRKGQQTQGKVVSVQQGRDSDGAVTYARVIEFEVNGEKITITGADTMYRPEVGKIVNVKYMVSDGVSAVVDETMTYLFPVISIVFIIGVVGFIIYTMLSTSPA